MISLRKSRGFSCLNLQFLALFIWLLTISAFAQQPTLAGQNHVSALVSTGQAPLVGALPATQSLNITFVMPLRNQADLTSLISRLYDPSSPDYRQFLSVDQFTNQFGPTAEDYQAVVDFAQANGLKITDTSSNRMIVPVTGTVRQIEKALNVKMNLYKHPTENRDFYSPDREPTLALNVSIAHIAGLDNATIPKPASLKASTDVLSSGSYTGSGPFGQYLGSDLRAAYYGGSTLTGAGQAVGLVEYYGGYNLSDVNMSFSSAGQTYSVPVNNVLLDGLTAGPGSGGDGEQVLDIVAAIGMAPGLSQVRVYIGNTDTDIYNAIAKENIAKVISVSWIGGNDSTAVDGIFQEMAVQGQSIFAAAGDWGSYTPGSGAFPAEDVNVTAVGGTNLPTYTTPWPEIGWGTGACSPGSYCATGGGISPDGIAIPSWQTGVANSANGASTTLRNVPDVAAISTPGLYICPGGSCGTWYGTSLASPLWAAFTALADQEAVSAGKAPMGGLGFLNPTIYAIGKGSSYSSDFHDIVGGNNGGFNAVAGYDLMTGWGSPTGQNTIDALAGVKTVGISTTAYYQIVNQASNSCIDDTAGGTSNGTILQQWLCYGGNVNQEWLFTAAGGGYYEVTTHNSANAAWNVVNVGNTPGTGMQLWGYGGASNEIFKPIPLSNGYYEFSDEHSGLCLNVPNGSTSNGLQLQIDTCNGSASESFKLNQL